MKIALDYDRTYTRDPALWEVFALAAASAGHEVRIVTARSPNDDNISHKVSIPVIYCDGIAKKFYCHWFADNYKGWDPDVWIDDKPEGILNNSTATKEILENWRASEEYNA